MIQTQVTSGTGTGYKACVTSHNALCVAQIIPDVPDVGDPNRVRYLKGKLGQTGLDSGNTDLAVDGSLTSVEFFAESDNDFDIHIMSCDVLIADLLVPLNRFGNIAGGLAVGFDLQVIEGGVETFVIEKALTNGEVIIQSGAAWAAVELPSYLANSNAWVIKVPLSEFVPGGLRLGRGTKDQFVATVNDDLIDLDLMEVAIFGYKHIP